MAKKFDLTRELAGMLTALLAWRSDTGVYASAIARELGLTIEDDEATVLARLREALAAPAPETGKPACTFRRSDVPGCLCGHVSADHHRDSVSGKRTYCHECDPGACRQYTAEPEPDGLLDVWQLACGCAVESRDLFAGQNVFCQMHGNTLVEDAPRLESAEPTYLLACKCQMLGTRAIGEQVTCGLHGDTTVVMAIPLGAPAEPDRAPEPGAPAEAAPGKLTITDTEMISDTTRHKAGLVKLPSPLTGYSWQVTWLPGRHLTRDQAITAMTIAEFAVTDRGALGDVLSPAWSHLAAWSDEIGITPERALAMVSVPPEDVEAADS